MKFWQKAFICIVNLFLVAVNVMGYVLAERSYALNTQYAVASAEAEYAVILKSLNESIALSETMFTELNAENLSVTISPYADFYRGQGIFFQLYQNGVLAYSNSTVDISAGGNAAAQGERLIEMETSGGNLYCVISSGLNPPYENLQYVYIKDMQSLVNFKADVIKNFTAVSMVVGCVLAVIMLFLLIALTRPFRRLNAAAAEISKGNYDKRVMIKSRDEIGEFAVSFNLMADHISGHIAELSRMAESKQNFIDNLAHEIRTPITAVVGYGELLQYANCTEDERQTAIRHIISQGKRIQSMSYKLLDLAYMDNKNIQMSPVQLEDVLTNATVAVNSGLTEKNITVRPIQTGAALSRINGDAELLESLFVNLLDNAVCASDAGSAVDIHTTTAHDSVTVEIIDHGKGIEQSEIAKITEPFYRVDKSRSGKGGHAGLGLTLCAQICKIHNADFGIESKLGEGTAIKIIFYNSATTR